MSGTKTFATASGGEFRALPPGFLEQQRAQSADVTTKADQGSAYVFARNTGRADNWGQTNRLTASDGAPSDDFGWSVGLWTDAAVVRALVQEWVNSTLANNGLLLRAESSFPPEFYFTSAEGGTVGWRPKLVIRYH